MSGVALGVMAIAGSGCARISWYPGMTCWPTQGALCERCGCGGVVCRDSGVGTLKNSAEPTRIRSRARIKPTGRGQDQSRAMLKLHLGDAL